MGRRALPGIDRSIPIDQHYRELAELTPPLDVEKFFGRSGSLEIEIGSGKGLFLLNASGANPDRLFLGLEVSNKYSRFAAYRLAQNNRDNARMIHGDAIRFMHEFVPDQCAQAVHVYFPDPWWKERHRRRRVIQSHSVADIQRVLIPGGQFHFWTDVEEYFETVCQMMGEFPAFSGPLVVAQSPADHDMDYRTHFERRMRINDHPVFRTRFELTGCI